MRVVYREKLPRADLRLGRHINHDSESRRYPVDTSGLAIRSIRWTRHAPVFDQGSLGSCFPPGTRVRMADGSERVIEGVRLGEHVVTAEGHTGRVTRTMLRDEDGGLVRLVIWGHAHLRMTREHPVLTDRGYVPAAELRIGDRVAFPRYMSTQPRTDVVVADHVERASHRLVRGNRWQGVPGRSGLAAGSHVLPEKISLDARFGRLIGLFLAEGCCDSGKATWTLHIDERATLGAEIVSVLADYGVTAHTKDIPSHKTHKVTVHGTAWTRLLSSLCGNGAGLKRLHSDLTAGPSNFLAAVFSGWRDGDAHQRPNRAECVGVSISRDLALGMYDIAQALGLRPVIRHVPPVNNRHAQVRRWRWEVGTSSTGASGYSTQDERHVWRKVRELRVEDYVGPVYNLSVEGDESYVAEGIGVHNCTGNAGVGCLATDPFYDTLPTAGRYGLTEAGAVQLYSDATAADPYPGSYPPNDTGSDGLTIAKVLTGAGEISGYTWAFSLDDALAALSTGPLITGVNWYNNMFDPTPQGLVHPTGGLAGGHEIVVDEYDGARGLVGFTNSWSTSWGLAGRFYMQAEEYGTLLGQQGDVTVFVPVTAPAPVPVPPGPVGVDEAMAAAARGWLAARPDL